MAMFEYEITSYPEDAFKEVVYFCSSDGVCNLEKVPLNQLQKMQDILNKHGQDGWELVHLAFGSNGILAFWKRMVETGDEQEG